MNRQHELGQCRADYKTYRICLDPEVEVRPVEGQIDDLNNGD